MIEIELNGAAPTHVERIKPIINTDASGKISWVPGLIDHNATKYYRGKTVTPEEFNEVLLKQIYQNNYLTDTITELFDKQLPLAIYRKFTTDFNLIPSFIKTFSIADWGIKNTDGYYYITIPASEHGFTTNDSESAIERMNMDVEMYVLDSTGHFHEVPQSTVDSNNTVQLYTDDNTLSGFVVIRTNDKAYALAAATIDATQITGLANVATSAKYADLVDTTRPDGTGPDDKIKANKEAIEAIVTGTTQVPNAAKADVAQDANNLIGTIRNISLDNIFETGSSVVKNATEAQHAINANEAQHSISAENATNATNAINAVLNSDGTYTGLTLDENGVLKIGDIIIPQKKPLITNVVYTAEATNLGLRVTLPDTILLSLNKHYLIKGVVSYYSGVEMATTFTLDYYNTHSLDIFSDGACVEVNAINNQGQAISALMSALSGISTSAQNSVTFRFTAIVGDYTVALKNMHLKITDIYEIIE